VLEESRKIPVEELTSFVEEAMHNGWEPVVAIVDRYGDITYYRMRPLRPRGKQN
jgi:tRNA-intron endonuclease